MANPDKIIRDPLYNYIALERGSEGWLIDLINTKEVQRLRRVRQLGVSHVTYPGAEHTRLSHTLGVMHLMQLVLRQLAVNCDGPRVQQARAPLMAAAVLHDVGHGPFSHVFEPLLNVDHEVWSCRVIQESGTEVHEVLNGEEIPLEHVVSIIQKDNRTRPPWQKALLSSELDVDRLDYLRRDSYFTGAGYGHFDWYRILNLVSLDEGESGWTLTWPESAKYAIEEYIFARNYMYQNVYQHKTTRGLEKVIHAAWRRANTIEENGGNAWFMEEINEFRHAVEPTVGQYLALDDAMLLHQLAVWARHGDTVLGDLARRFVHRKPLKVIPDPVPSEAFEDVREAWETALHEEVSAAGFDPAFYALRDDLKQTVYDPYSPEKEEAEQDPYNAILIKRDSKHEEISGVLPRLGSVTGKRPKEYRYYVPRQAAGRVQGRIERGDWK